MAEYIVTIDHPELCVEYGGSNFTEILERIVRCRDCRWAHPMEPDGYRLDCHGYLATCWDYENDCPQRNVVKPDGFCAWGERKVGK